MEDVIVSHKCSQNYWPAISSVCSSLATNDSALLLYKTNLFVILTMKADAQCHLNEKECVGWLGENTKNRNLRWPSWTVFIWRPSGTDLWPCPFCRLALSTSHSHPLDLSSCGVVLATTNPRPLHHNLPTSHRNTCQVWQDRGISMERG